MSDNVEELLEQRGNQWGDAVGTHVRIAQVWSGILGHEVSALQVALCMTGLKLVRGELNPDEIDSFNDGHGYLRIGELIAGHRTSLSEKKPASVVVVQGAGSCKNCSHPKSMHRARSGAYPVCEGSIVEGPGDVRFCDCTGFQESS